MVIEPLESRVCLSRSFGDANGDGVVDTLDFNVVAANFNKSGALTRQHGDFNHDFRVNALDFNVLASNFGVQMAITHWTGDNSGDLSDSGNYLDGIKPGSDDVLRFDHNTHAISTWPDDFPDYFNIAGLEFLSGTWVDGSLVPFALLEVSGDLIVDILLGDGETAMEVPTVGGDITGAHTPISVLAKTGNGTVNLDAPLTIGNLGGSQIVVGANQGDLTITTGVGKAIFSSTSQGGSPSATIGANFKGELVADGVTVDLNGSTLASDVTLTKLNGGTFVNYSGGPSETVAFRAFGAIVFDASMEETILPDAIRTNDADLITDL